MILVNLGGCALQSASVAAGLLRRADGADRVLDRKAAGFKHVDDLAEVPGERVETAQIAELLLDEEAVS